MKYIFSKRNNLLIKVVHSQNEFQEFISEIGEDGVNDNYIIYESNQNYELDENSILIYDIIAQSPRVLQNKDKTNYLIAHNLLEFDYLKQYVDEQGNIKNISETELYEKRLNEIKQIKIRECNEFTKNLLESGFTYNNTLYDTKLEDQTNFIGYFLMNADFEIRCTRNNVKKLYFHTKEEIREVFLEFSKHKREILNKCNQIKQEINKNNNIAELLNLNIQEKFIE